MSLNSRYKNSMTPEFSDQNILNAWRDVELAVLKAKYETTGNKEFLECLNALAVIGDVNVARKEEIEKETKHDLVAAIRAMAEQVDALKPGMNLGRLIHQGITSYDTEDTATSLMLHAAGRKILAGLDKLKDAFEAKAELFKFAPCLGYTHNQVAEPITIGKRFLDIAVGIDQQNGKLADEIEEINQCKIKGAVGIHSGALTPSFENKVAAELGQKVSRVATQILPIEDLLPFFAPMLTIACKLENWAQNMRLLSGAEAEVKEGFAKKQTGSSVMTFKQNPINIENITGAARAMKALFAELMNATGTWRERDISNSFQIQRHVVPEIFEVMEHLIQKTMLILDGLQIFPIQSFRNLDKYGDMLFAGAAKDWLATNLPAAGDNEAIYKMVQKESIDSKYSIEFRGGKSHLTDKLADVVHEKIGAGAVAKFKNIMSVSYNLRNVAANYSIAGLALDSRCEEMVDYIIETGQLAHFGEKDALGFIDAYEKIVVANHGSFGGIERAVAKFKNALNR
ncbi:MAG: hypothetical protein LBG89_04120 [Rickettsiales bacterium]|jgi:adenylosuccinate lyase|nr:hypothetical protein [Rickettsiales bacterium]